MAALAFGTKAETLERLTPLLESARILPLFRFAARRWTDQRATILARIASKPWAERKLIVRSSAAAEDSGEGSLAGRFTSIAGVAGQTELARAIDQVIASYGPLGAGDQVLIQPQLAGITLSGVAFSRDPANGAPYIVINYDLSGDSAAVTGGRAGGLRTFVYWKHGHASCEPRLQAVIALTGELERLFAHDSLDIEFAFDDSDRLFLFQVRKLILRDALPDSARDHGRLLSAIADKIALGMRPHPYLHGARTVYGVMPDWNPAEIIGIRPRPLALSLYRALVTDAIWAYQRNNYGYKNLRSFPLMIHFHGLPYIDVRVSFNSFVPRDIDGALADRLVNYYIERLLAAPVLHDKVEFEIVFSCYTLDLPEKLAVLDGQGFDQADRDRLKDSLRSLTNRIIHRDAGLWRVDGGKLKRLEERQAAIMNSDLDKIARIYWLLEDCKRYGTLPFAGLARAGFIAVQLLRSMVAVGVLSETDAAQFMSSLDTVSGRLGRDLAQLSRATFLAKYGHLRPGTYDILSPRYDEAPDRYFDWSGIAANAEPEAKAEDFRLSLGQMHEIGRLLAAHGLDHDLVGLFDFLKAGIEGREYAKFLFTRSLSDALSLVERLGADHGFTIDDMSYADIGAVYELYGAGAEVAETLGESIERGRARYRRARQILLPPLLTSADDVWSFHMPPSEPNYITHKQAIGPVRNTGKPDDLAGAIILIPNADPGFDWIFCRNIAGFITAYGGSNSHMAIRASELGLPAVIGAGEALYAKWAGAHTLRIDCANRRVEVLR